MGGNMSGETSCVPSQKLRSRNLAAVALMELALLAARLREGLLWSTSPGVGGGRLLL
jgi:hypothetical protein